jgi:ubiquinone/menaquinone biosynthesis C-methylase UbiE
MLARALAKQLAYPSGVLGRLMLAPLWNRRNTALNDAAFDGLALRPHDRVLEVGFGGGYLLGRMAAVVTEGFLAGVDASPAMVALCQKRYRALIETGDLELKCAKAEALPYPPASFNKVCTVNSIFYWESAPQAISELRRVLEENGALVLCFTCKDSVEDRRFARHGMTLYDAGDIDPMMTAAGFRELSFTHSSDQHRELWFVVGQG